MTALLGVLGRLLFVQFNASLLLLRSGTGSGNVLNKQVGTIVLIRTAIAVAAMAGLNAVAASVAAIITIVIVAIVIVFVDLIALVLICVLPLLLLLWMFCFVICAVAVVAVAHTHIVLEFSTLCSSTTGISIGLTSVATRSIVDIIIATSVHIASSCLQNDIRCRVQSAIHFIVIIVGSRVIVVVVGRIVQRGLVVRIVAIHTHCWRYTSHIDVSMSSVNVR